MMMPYSQRLRDVADWFRQMCRKYPGRLVLGLDARDGRVATDGWLETSGQDATELPPDMYSRDMKPNVSNGRPQRSMMILE